MRGHYVTGSRGIGKSALAAHVADMLRPDFDLVMGFRE
jgi:nucleoside-triphosphatase THEP1